MVLDDQRVRGAAGIGTAAADASTSGRKRFGRGRGSTNRERIQDPAAAAARRNENSAADRERSHGSAGREEGTVAGRERIQDPAATAARRNERSAADRGHNHGGTAAAGRRREGSVADRERNRRGAAADRKAAERAGNRKRTARERFVREVLAQSGVAEEQVDQARRLPDTLREVGETALHAVRKWADPRERELRRRRRVRRRSLRLSAASGLTALGTAGLVVVSAPAWAVIVVGSGAAALVTGAAVTTKRYFELRRNPLPPAAFVPRKLPPIRSAARDPIARLVRAERAFYAVGRQIAHGGRLPEDDLTDTVETADSAAAALHALAADIVAMEHAAGLVAQWQTRSGSSPSDPVRATVARLLDGVAEYEELVASASRVLAVPESPAFPDDLGWAMADLRDAADRLDGWAQALTELADRH
ncbi:phage shock envelope stress response protein PspM [Nocardia wallacei]|uniref:phage shock envelope stress response protein PspM n=1 Tax=Nocardia wallacei TaxID=480035 RepID=UPI002457E12F|nr:hypothetical protein [Nocardia wallacei]